MYITMSEPVTNSLKDIYEVWSVLISPTSKHTDICLALRIESNDKKNPYFQDAWCDTITGRVDIITKIIIFHRTMIEEKFSVLRQ